MDALDAIMTRRSIRKYTDQPIDDATLRQILAAGMSGPTATNARDWHFLVIRDRETLNQMADANGRAATPLREAAVGILICGDLERAFPRARDYWVIDGAIAGQNMILAAHALGIGSVWLGTWPQEEKVEAQRTLFGLPDTVAPHSIIAFGYPAEDKSDLPHPDYEEDRVHFACWEAGQKA